MKHLPDGWDPFETDGIDPTEGMALGHDLHPIPESLRKASIDDDEFDVEHAQALVDVSDEPSRPDHGLGVETAHPEEQAGDDAADET